MFGRQKTVRNKVECVGIGLHTGEQVSITLLPAAPDTGIVFQRVDQVDGNPYVQAIYNNVCNTMLGTTLANSDGIKVATIEHLMAAFWGCGIDNCIVELNGPEIPIMDGSSEPFVFLIECAGTVEQERSRKVIEVLKEVSISENEQPDAGHVSVRPALDFSVSLEIDFGDKVISNQKSVFNSRELSFKSELCRARTFGFAHEVDYLQERGLAKGGSLDNAIVVDKEGILNDEGLRYDNEFVRHKILDCIGDVFLAGGYIKGHFHGFKSGHALNNQLLHKFFEDKEAWRVVQIPEESGFPLMFETRH